MPFVYILKSLVNGRYYIGSTNDLERQILEHNSGKTKSLKKLIPLKIVFSQPYVDMRLAMAVEIHLKKLKSRIIIEQIIKDEKVKIGMGL